MNRLHENCRARLKGRIDCAGHGKSTLIRSPHLPRPSSKRNDREIERRHRFFTSTRTDLLSHWTSENCPKLSSVGHFQSEQAFTPPIHFRTLFGFSEKFGNCRPPLNANNYCLSRLPSHHLSTATDFLLISEIPGRILVFK